MGVHARSWEALQSVSMHAAREHWWHEAMGNVAADSGHPQLQKVAEVEID